MDSSGTEIKGTMQWWCSISSNYTLAPGTNPIPALTSMINIQTKVNVGSSSTVLSDSNIAAAMLGALPDADWSVEKEILKEKSNIAPANIIAKVQLKWPSKTFGITSPHPWHQSLPSLTLTLVICPAQTIS
jgi:hypothetical protein